MKKYVMITVLVLILSSCIYLYIRDQSNPIKSNTTNITDKSTQFATTPPRQQVSPPRLQVSPPCQQVSPPRQHVSQEPSQSIIPQEQSNNVASEEIVNCLTKEEREHNQMILDNLLQFQELAKQFCKQSDTVKSEELLMASFIRSGEERYTDEVWGKIAGECEDFKQFLEKVDNNQSHLYLKETKFLYDPVTGEKIDFIHLMATLNVYLNQDLLYQLYPDVGDVGGWAGDCIQLAREAKDAEVEEHGLVKFMNERLGITGKFGMGDILADIDALNLYEELEEGADISTVWESYYSSLGKTTRYKKFMNYRFPGVKSEEELTLEIQSIMASEYSLAISQVYQREGLDQQDRIYSKAAGECFAEYIWRLH